MSEGTLLIVWICKFLVIGGTATFYRLGGWLNKGIRRFGAPCIYMGGCVGIALWKGVFNPFMLLSLPLWIGSLCLGYSNNEGRGFGKRLLAGCAFAISALPFVICFNGWILFIYHSILCVSAMVGFGLLNPFKNAVDEESFIAVMSFSMPIAMI